MNESSLLDEDDDDDVSCDLSAAWPFGHIDAQCGRSVTALQSLQWFSQTRRSVRCILRSNERNLFLSPLGVVFPLPFVSLALHFHISCRRMLKRAVIAKLVCFKCCCKSLSRVVTCFLTDDKGHGRHGLNNSTSETWRWVSQRESPYRTPPAGSTREGATRCKGGVTPLHVQVIGRSARDAQRDE